MCLLFSTHQVKSGLWLHGGCRSEPLVVHWPLQATQECISGYSLIADQRHKGASGAFQTNPSNHSSLSCVTCYFKMTFSLNHHHSWIPITSKRLVLTGFTWHLLVTSYRRGDENCVLVFLVEEEMGARLWLTKAAGGGWASWESILGPKPRMTLGLF